MPKNTRYPLFIPRILQCRILSLFSIRIANLFRNYLINTKKPFTHQVCKGRNPRYHLYSAVSGILHFSHRKSGNLIDPITPGTRELLPEGYGCKPDLLIKVPVQKLPSITLSSNCLSAGGQFSLLRAFDVLLFLITFPYDGIFIYHIQICQICQPNSSTILNFKFTVCIIAERYPVCGSPDLSIDWRNLNCQISNYFMGVT